MEETQAGLGFQVQSERMLEGRVAALCLRDLP